MTHPATVGFSGQTVMVTGASRGIGYGVARAFAQHGANLHILAQGEEIHDAARQIADETGQSVTGWTCDITDSARVDEVFAQAGPLGVFVANAGLEAVTPISDRSARAETLFRRVTEINTIGTYLTTRAALPQMGPGGRIIITASIWGSTAVPELSAYVASKHANIGFMRSIAKELGPHGIRVNAVCPGWVMTGPARNTLQEMARERGAAEDVIAQEISAEQSLPGVQSADDVALSYLYLASPLAANITGQTLNADRGAVQG
ncbi:3-beta hydroxysteroid dehydrogenase [Leisingera sp. ANG-M1]|uniref:SDR family NAD(P)-dependent oxidoreductase n=1 Tax=Leisingera sp. ANG-M1 TaxID=1577895 RepID=UPI00057DB98A|nr:SDR family oxidoreductase [Leisingera sp. ANG-M1]KIC08538.1 3-beta hydroxysteroid dehydrogenase [Leisingera sp. ANG-M1]